MPINNVLTEYNRDLLAQQVLNQSFNKKFIERVLTEFAGQNAPVPAAVQEQAERSDPDGPLVPLPARAITERVVPLFPLAAYRALIAPQQENAE